MKPLRHYLTLCLLLAALALPAAAQTVGRVEYFWDSDPGFGAGLALKIVDTFLQTGFDGSYHADRVALISDIERRERA